MRITKVKGTAVSRWFKSKLWFSLNSEIIKEVAGIATLFIVGYVLMVMVMAIS